MADLGGDKIAKSAVARIVAADADPSGPMMGRGSGKRIQIGQIDDDGAKLAFSATGRILVNGKLAGTGPGKGADSVAIYGAARIAADRGGLFADLPMSSAMRGRVLAQLGAAIDFAQSGKRTNPKDRTFAGSMTLLIDLARATPKSDTTVKRAVLDTLIQALHREGDVEMVAFYLQSMRDLFKKLDKVQFRALKTVTARVLPKRAPIEAWTENRTKPLEVRHMIHEEFWKEELAFFSKKNGFKLVKKDKKDTKRVYEGLLKDPSGKKKPLQVRIEIQKGELDFLEGMSDEKAHVIMYSGHSALGGNGSQAVAEAAPMKGDHTKLVFIANCRGKDNYAHFTNKYPSAHAIMTEHPTYSTSGQDRVAGLFDMLVRGNTYRYMRSITEYEWWDEPADNYFYPDEWRKFAFMDADSDGKVDFAPSGQDRLFDVDMRAAGDNFVRALNFANSELFYHWEVEHENGNKSFFGQKYGDSLVPDGSIRDPKPGELVRVTPVGKKLKNGKKATRFRVRFNPKPAERTDENLYAAQVTMHTAIALAEHKTGTVTKRDVLRGVLMGAQAIHYMDVYSDSSPKTTKDFFAKLGLTKTMDSKDLDQLFKDFDAHANAAQITAFEAMLADDYGIDVDKWFAKFEETLSDTELG